MSLRGMLILAVVLLGVLRGWLVLGTGVSPANAYFSVCGSHPALGYFDGPAGPAMMVRAVSLLGGEWWLLLGPLWSVLASLAAWRVGVRLFGQRGAIWGTLALNALPVFNSEALTAGGVLPSLTFFLLGSSLVWDAVRQQKPSLGAWLAAAFSFGGACLFAYWPLPAALAVISVPFAKESNRKPVNTIGAVSVVILLVAALVPSWIWNESTDWIAFAGWTFRGLIGFVASDAAAGFGNWLVGISPIFAVAVLVSWFRGLSQSTNPGKGHESFAVVASMVSLALGLLFAWRGWDASIFYLPACAVLLPRVCLTWAPWLAGSGILTAGLLSLPVLTSYSEKTTMGREAADAVIALEEKLAPEIPEGLFFIASDAEMAAVLDYHLRDAFIPPEGHPRVYAKSSQDISNQFALWPSYDDFVETAEPPDEFFTEQRAVNPFLGHSAIYISRENPQNLPSAIRSAFAEVQLVQQTGKGNDQLFIYLCLDYQTLPL